MAAPLPIYFQARGTPSAAAASFGTSETVLGKCHVSATGKPPGELAIRFSAECSAVTGTATIRLREGSIAGTILATCVVTAAGTVVTATGTRAAPSAPILLFVTGQNSTATSTIRFFDTLWEGDGSDPAFDALTGTEWTELSPWSGGLMFRDDTDRTWLLDRDDNVAYSRDELTRVFPQYVGAGHRGAKQIKPWSVLVGTDIWMFSVSSETPDLADNFDPDQYELTVLDGIERTVKNTSTIVTGLAGIQNIAAVYDGGLYVWVFIVKDGDTITVHKWLVDDVAAGATSTTYRTVATARFQTIDASLLTGGEIAVVACSVSGHTLRIDHSYLDTTTAAAKVSPAAVTTTVTAVTPSAITCGGVSIFVNQLDAATNWRYAYWQSDPLDGSKVDLLMKTITSSTLAIASSTTLTSITPGTINDAVVMGQVSGARTDDGEVIWWGHLKDDPSAGLLHNAVNQVISNGTVGGSTVAIRASWLASKPFQYNDTWYVLTGFDDGEDQRLQRCLHVRKHLNTNVLAQIGYSEIGASYFLSASGGVIQMVDYPDLVDRGLPFVTPVVQVPGGKLVAGICVGGTIPSSDQVNMLTLDFEADYSHGSIVPGEALVYPGGVPQIAGPRDNLHDLSPLLAPYYPPVATAGAGTDLDPVSVVYLYSFTDASGRVYRSPPSPVLEGAIFKDGLTGTLTFKNLLHIGRGKANIECYATFPGESDLRLQFILPNNPAAFTQAIVVAPQRWSATTELLYTTGGGLVNFPPPPCRNVTTWRDRVFLSGTNIDGEVWFSQESEEGIGVRLHPVLRTNWGNKDGAIIGMGPVDWNYLGFLREYGAAVISGPGPNGLGSGNYVVQELTTRRGASSPNSLVSGPSGLYFQAASDGLIYLLGSNLNVQDVGQGIAASMAGRTVVAAAHMVTASQLWFFLDNSYIAVLDYKYPTQESPNGQWYLWNSDGLDSTCIGALEDGDGEIVWLQANKVLRTIRNDFTDLGPDGDDNPVLMRLKTGKMSPAKLQGEFYAEQIKFLGQHVGTSTLRVDVTNDNGTSELHDIATDSPTDYLVKPGNCLKTQEIQVSVEETASTTEGFVYDGLEVDVVPTGRAKFNNTGKRF